MADKEAIIKNLQALAKQGGSPLAPVGHLGWISIHDAAEEIFLRDERIKQLQPQPTLSEARGLYNRRR